MVEWTKVLLVATAVVGACEAARPFSSHRDIVRLTGLQRQKAITSFHEPLWNVVPRGGDAAAETLAPGATLSAAGMVQDAVKGLSQYMQGPKSDTLLLLLTTAINTPLCKRLGTSPILGFLATGILFGPNGGNLIKDVHKTELLADLGIVFFLFEMGIHLSIDTLISMRRDVFGLGLSQFVITSLAIAGIAALCGFSSAAMVVLGGGLALSSSAFVLQLLKDGNELGTRFGKSSFGVLLLQDLAVVPLLVVTPILAGGGGDLTSALSSALVQATMALSAIAVIGRFFLNPFFDFVVGAQSQEALLGAILLTVLSMSFLTEGLGLSNTLGAFLAGVLLSDSKYRHEIETEISPFRGILVGLFFFTVGFEIDLNLIASRFGLVSSIVLGIVALKTAITTVLCLAFGLPLATSQRAGLLLSQGGEFAFVAFRLARSLDILDADTTKLMLTCVSLTMGITPFLEELGKRVATKLDENESKKIR